MVHLFLREHDCAFRHNAGTDSDGTRAAIPIDRGQPFRLIAGIGRRIGGQIVEATRTVGNNLPKAPMIGNAALDHETRAVCEQAIDTFRGLGTDVREIEIDLSKAVDILFVLTGALAHAAYADKMPEFGDRIDKSLKIGIEGGAKLTASELETALFDRAELFRVVEAAFADFDLLVTPSLTRPAIAADHFAWDGTRSRSTARPTSRRVTTGIPTPTRSITRAIRRWHCRPAGPRPTCRSASRSSPRGTPRTA